MIYEIGFTRTGLLGTIFVLYIGTLNGAKARATRLYHERLAGPWVVRVVEHRTAKLAASRIGLAPWRNA